MTSRIPSGKTGFLERAILLHQLLKANKRLLILLVSVLAFSAVLVTGLISTGLVGASGDGDIVATINDIPITREEFYERMEKEIGEQVMNQLIAEALVLSAKGVTVSDEAVNAEIELIKANYPSQEIFEEIMAQYGLTMESLAREVRINLILAQLASADVTVTDAEIKAYFESNKATLGSPKQVRSSHILVDSLAEAEMIVAELKDGADFATLAKTISKDAGSAVQGGDIGFIGPDDPIVPEYLDAVFKMAVGEISAPVKSQFGYHIIKVTAINEAKEAVLEEQIETIKNVLIQEKARPFNEVVNDLYQNAKVVVNWERYKGFENQ
jgi:foldase protein PrsA